MASIKRVIKIMDEVRKAVSGSGLTDKDLRELTSEYGESIRDRLIQGIEGGYSVDGHRFTRLQASTLAIRRARGNSSTDFLQDRHGGIISFLEGNDLFHAGKVQINLNKPYNKYMEYQNEGFTPDKIPVFNNKNKLVYIPNIKKKSVPARKWLGIPKAYKEGGTKYNEFLKKFTQRIEKNLTKAIKRF